MSVLEIQFDNAERSYAAGGMMSGQVSLLVSEVTPCRGIVLEYWWEARGTGVTDRGPVHKKIIDVHTLAGHIGQRVTNLTPPAAEQADVSANNPVARVNVVLLEPRETYVLPFYIAAPPGPVSYHSEHLQLDWHMRVRVGTTAGQVLKLTRTFKMTAGSASEADLGLVSIPAGSALERHVKLPSMIASSTFLGIGVLAFIALGTYLLPLPSQFPSRVEDYLSLPALVAALIYVIIMTRALVRTLRARQFYSDMQVDMPAAIVAGSNLDVVMRFRPRYSSPRQRLQTRLVIEAFEQTRSASQQHTRCITSTVLDSTNLLDLVSHRETKVLERFQLPEGMVASFQSEHHSVYWKVMLEAQFGSLPVRTSNYDFVVQPWRTLVA
ncbi:MAG: hypothetical protein AAF267_04280 [Deinococcota bacterium]